MAWLFVSTMLAVWFLPFLAIGDWWKTGAVASDSAGAVLSLCGCMCMDFGSSKDRFRRCWCRSWCGGSTETKYSCWNGYDGESEYCLLHCSLPLFVSGTTFSFIYYALYAKTREYVTLSSDKIFFLSKNLSKDCQDNTLSFLSTTHHNSLIQYFYIEKTMRVYWTSLDAPERFFLEHANPSSARIH